MQIERPEHAERLIREFPLQGGRKLTNEEIRDISVRFAEYLRQNNIPGMKYNESLNSVVVAIEKTLETIGASPQYRSGGAYREWREARILAGLSADGMDSKKSVGRVSLRGLNKFTRKLSSLLEEKGIAYTHIYPFWWELRANLVNEVFDFVNVEIKDFRYDS